jgi:transposase
MAYRYGDRRQNILLPPCIEEYVPADAPVRAYDAFIDALDFDELGIIINSGQVGNAQYDPRAMLKLLVYGYSYGIRSSRKLERAVHDNLSFIWLVGGLKPDHKTISEFRRNNKDVLRKVLKLSVRMCIRLDLIDGNVLFVDGTKIRANASRCRTHSREHYEKRLSETDARIEQLLTDIEAADDQEAGVGSFTSMNKDLSDSRKLKSKIESVLREFENTDAEKVNATDPDCRIMHSVQGSHAAYNVQCVTDDKHGLIVSIDAVKDANDLNQFAQQIGQACEETGKTCDTACGDAGYADTEELEKIHNQGIEVIVPSKRQALHGEEKPFAKSKFIYDKERDCYYCPEGHVLRRNGTDSKTGKIHYLISGPGVCRKCPQYGTCTSAKKGRTIVRIQNEEMKEKFEAHYNKPESQEIYKRRKCRAELPFGHIKRNLKTDGFLLRGLKGVRAEAAVAAACFNIVRMITIFGGVCAFIGKISPAGAFI